MNIVEKISTAIIESLEKNDEESYKHYRDELIIKVANQDFFSLEDIENYFIVGKALVLILDDMYKSPPLLYKRVVLCAVYCLLKTIINDKYDKQECTVHASVMLYILFSENKDFIGGEYMISKLRNNVKAAAYQFVGMQNVFYWKYKLSNKNIHFSQRIMQRLISAVSPSTSKIPDESTRKKVIDFEYDNFSSLLEFIPVDIEMKYHGVFIDPLDSEILDRLKSVFKSNTSNFSREEVQKTYDTKVLDMNTSTSNKCNNSKNGCMGIVTFALIIIVTMIIFN